MNQEITNPYSYQLLILAFKNLEKPFTDKHENFHRALHKLSKKPEYNFLFKEIAFNTDKLPPTSNAIYQGFFDLLYYGIINWSFDRHSYNLSNSFTIKLEKTKKQFLGQENLLEQFANDFKQELISLGGYKK